MKRAPTDNVDEPLGLVDGLLKDLSAITTQSIAADLRAIRTHQDRIEARTDTRLRLAELAAMLQDSRLLTAPLLADYANREATKQAHSLTTALLRQLSTRPPASRTSPDGIPKSWESDLAIGGDGEKICRRTITESILRSWVVTEEPALPVSPADLTRYGQTAYDLAKACALSIAAAGYRLAKPDADIIALMKLTAQIHEACPPPKRSDPLDLARELFITPAVWPESLPDAAAQLAKKYLHRSKVHKDAWASLGQAVVDGYAILEQLAASSASAPSAQTKSMLAHDDIAAKQVNTYLRYLGPDGNAVTVARKLFDLAATQRAMLPAEADIEQSLDLVQVSADTRSLLAPNRQTAQQKLTGMQFHHFGAFYKRSWRANDWMWGRLDGAGWLVHVLLDPRRVRWIVQSRTDGAESGARWFLNRLKVLGAPDFPREGDLTEDELLDELGFLDDSSMATPSSIPKTSTWIAQTWQQLVLDEELDELAKSVIGTNEEPPQDWSPASSRKWARRVLTAPSPAAKYALLKDDPVANETFDSDKSSPLMARTIAKAAATAIGATGSVQQLPGVLKPPMMTLRTLTLGGYRVVSASNGVARSIIITGVVMLAAGAAVAIQSATLFGFTGLVLAGIGGYLTVLGTWQIFSRLPFALLSMTLVAMVFALTTPFVREWLFGTAEEPGLVGAHAYLLGTRWWHPLIIVGAIALGVTAIAATSPERMRLGTLQRTRSRRDRQRGLRGNVRPRPRDPNEPTENSADESRTPPANSPATNQPSVTPTPVP